MSTLESEQREQRHQATRDVDFNRGVVANVTARPTSLLFYRAFHLDVTTGEPIDLDGENNEEFTATVVRRRASRGPFVDASLIFPDL